MKVYVITEKMNPETGVSILFNKDRFASKEVLLYQNKTEAPKCINKALQKHRDECLCLMAKGYSIMDTLHIITSIYLKDFSEHSIPAMRSNLARCAYYYSAHIEELIHIVGDYNFKCKEILNKLNKLNKTPVDSPVQPTSHAAISILDKNTDLILERIKDCFAEIHDLILTYPDRIFDLKEIEYKIKENQTDLGKFKTLDDLTQCYLSIKSLYIKRDEMKKLKKDEAEYKQAYIVKCLKESGIDKAIKKFNKLLQNI